MTERVAAQQGFKLFGIHTGDDATAPQEGDSVTALVELRRFNGKLQPSQWLMRVQLSQPVITDALQRKTSDVTQYTNTGESFTFHSQQTGMKLESIGPLTATTNPNLPVAIKRHEIVAATDFLGLELNRTALVLSRIFRQPTGKNDILSLTVRSSPFSTAEIDQQKPRAAALKLTSADLRSFSGSLPALLQFLDIVRSTPDLQSILFQVLDKPSLLDVLRSGASSSLTFNFVGGGPSNGREIFWPGQPAEDFDLIFFNVVVFKKPVLTVVVYVTAPRPPLLLTAGIVGLVAFKPNPDASDKLVVVRVLSAAAGSKIPPATDATR